MDEEALNALRSFSEKVRASSPQKAARKENLLKRDNDMITATREFMAALAKEASTENVDTWTCGFGTAFVQPEDYTTIKAFVSHNRTMTSVVEVNYLEERCSLRIDDKDYRAFDRTKSALYRELSRAFLKVLTL